MSDHPVHAMRRSYENATLREAEVGGDPLALFTQWFDHAKAAAPGGWLEVNAMTLATASPDGEVSARIVLLKGYGDPAVGDGGFCFYTNYASQKGQQLAANPQASLVLFWPHVERQVRITGTVERLPRELSEAYFRTRPRASQVGAAASAQSTVIESREALAARFAELEAEHRDSDIPMPDDWGGYALRPTAIEFWQGRPGRLHDRLFFKRREEGGWTVERLCP